MKGGLTSLSEISSGSRAEQVCVWFKWTLSDLPSCTACSPHEATTWILGKLTPPQSWNPLFLNITVDIQLLIPGTRLLPLHPAMTLHDLTFAHNKAVPRRSDMAP